MKNTIKFCFMGILTMLVTCAVFAVAVMLLWNALLPQIFALPQISYLQAAGLLILARLLFGGIGDDLHGRGRGAGRGRHPFHHGNKLHEKWMNMSEEERKEFMEKEKDFFKYHKHIFNGFFDKGRENEQDDDRE
jgi:hypothetical protein